MPTLNEIVYNIRNIARGGISTDDDTISNEQIKFWVRYHRARLVLESSIKMPHLEPQLYQDLGCLPLTEVDKADCPTTLIWGEGIKVTTIPDFISALPANKAIGFIGLCDKQTPITLTFPDVAGLSKYKKYTSNLLRAYFIGNKIYVYSNNCCGEDKDICFINVRGIFENPMDVEYTRSDGTCYQLTSDNQYPIPESYVDKLTNEIIKREIQPLFAGMQDELNDGRRPVQAVRPSKASSR